MTEIFTSGTAKWGECLGAPRPGAAGPNSARSSLCGRVASSARPSAKSKGCGSLELLFSLPVVLGTRGTICLRLFAPQGASQLGASTRPGAEGGSGCWSLPTAGREAPPAAYTRGLCWLGDGDGGPLEERRSETQSSLAMLWCFPHHPTAVQGHTNQPPACPSAAKMSGSSGMKCST